MKLTESEAAAISARNKAAWNAKGVKKAEVAPVKKGKVGSFKTVHELKPTKEALNSIKHAKPSKYKNKKTEVDGITFDSKKEAARWLELKALEGAGKISRLQRQVRVPIHVRDVIVAYWVADFQYNEGPEPPCVWEDVKSAYTRKMPLYRLKKKLVEAIYKTTIRET